MFEGTAWYLLAVLSITTSQKATTLAAIVVPYAALGLPLLDSGLAVVRRFVRGRPLFGADADHIHHRTLARLKKPKFAALLLYGGAAFFSLGSLVIVHVSGSIAALIAILGGVSAWFLAGFLKYEELPALNEYVGRSFQVHRRILARQVPLRQLLAELQSAPSLAEAWESFTDALEILEFDSADCVLDGTLVSQTPLLRWDRPGGVTGGAVWRLIIPLNSGGAELRLTATVSPQSRFLEMTPMLLPLVRALEEHLAAATAGKAWAAATGTSGSTD